MKLSTRSRYGTRVLVDMVVQAVGNKPYSVSMLAKRERISAKYLEHIMMRLKRAGIIRASGHKGYVLNRPAREISMTEVIRVLEGPIQLVPCTTPAYQCGLKRTCKTRLLWQGLDDLMRGALDRVSLADLAKGSISLKP